MRANNRCVKCQSSELVRIPPIPGEEPHIAVGSRGMHLIGVSKYVCGQCGYIEEWVDNTRDLEELRREYEPDGNS